MNTKKHIKHILIEWATNFRESVHIIPYLESIQLTYPNAKISIMTVPEAAELFEHDLRVNHVELYHPSTSHSIHYLRKKTQEFKKKNIDMFISLTGLKVPVIIAKKSHIKIRVIPRLSRWHKRMSTDSFSIFKTDHMYDYLGIALPELKKKSKVSNEIQLDPIDSILKIKKKYCDPSKKIIVIQTRHLEKNFYPFSIVEAFIDKCELINEFNIILLGNKVNNPLIHYNIKHGKNLIGRCTLVENVQWIQKADIYIGASNALTKLADQFKKPIVCFVCDSTWKAEREGLFTRYQQSVDFRGIENYELSEKNRYRFSDDLYNAFNHLLYKKSLNEYYSYSQRRKFHQCFDTKILNITTDKFEYSWLNESKQKSVTNNIIFYTKRWSLNAFIKLVKTMYQYNISILHGKVPLHICLGVYCIAPFLKAYKIPRMIKVPFTPLIDTRGWNLEYQGVEG